MSNPFNDETIRDWFLRVYHPLTRFAAGVVTLGSGPFDETEFDGFLAARAVKVVASCGDVEALVPGRDDWDPDEIDKHIESRRGKALRVYSQEMLMCYLATGRDPYDEPGLPALFGAGHPGLEYLQESGFDWPTTTVVPGFGAGLPDASGDWPQVGLLKHLGYEVGANGKPVGQRRAILRRVFDSPVPNVNSAEYMAEWGAPNTGARLQKLAYSIASFASLAKRRSNGPGWAIRDWEGDLAWLKETFYHGRFTFKWPSTGVSA